MMIIQYTPIPESLGPESRSRIQVLLGEDKYEQLAPKRIREIWASRLCILKCLGEEGLDSDFSKLKIHNYHYLKDYPQYLVSLSHNPTMSAAVMTCKDNLKSIGLDIESESRVVTPGMAKFFKNSYDDDSSAKTLLLLWISKEAAYKAIYPLNLKTPLTLHDIWIRENYFGLVGDDLKPLGLINYLYLSSFKEKYYLAQALILHSS